MLRARGVVVDLIVMTLAGTAAHTAVWQHGSGRTIAILLWSAVVVGAGAWAPSRPRTLVRALLIAIASALGALGTDASSQDLLDDRGGSSPSTAELLPILGVLTAVPSAVIAIAAQELARRWRGRKPS